MPNSTPSLSNFLEQFQRKQKEFLDAKEKRQQQKKEIQRKVLEETDRKMEISSKELPKKMRELRTKKPVFDAETLSKMLLEVETRHIRPQKTYLKEAFSYISEKR